MMPSSVRVGFHDSSVISASSTKVLLLDNFDTLASTLFLFVRYAFSGFDGWWEKWSISESYMLHGSGLELSFQHSFSSDKRTALQHGKRARPNEEGD